ncbi:Elongation of fatty acids protein 2, partial [Rhizophlyctis rosea]
MGIHHLIPSITRYAPTSIKSKPLAAFADKTIAVDASVYIHRFLKGRRHLPYNPKSTPKDISATRGAHVLGLHRMVHRLLSEQIKPVFVFDYIGVDPRNSAKALEREKRSLQRKLADKRIDEETKTAAWLARLEDAIVVLEQRSSEEAAEIIGGAREMLNREALVEEAMKRMTTSVAATTNAEDAEKENKSSLLSPSTLPKSFPVQPPSLTPSLTPSDISLHLAATSALTHCATGPTPSNPPLLTSLGRLVENIIDEGQMNEYTRLRWHNIHTQHQKTLNVLQTRNTFVTNEMIEDCEELLRRMKIPHYTVQSPIYEAEHICGSLAEHNLADAVLSEDTDALLMTDKEVLRSFKLDDGRVEVVDVEEVRKGMGLSREQVCIAVPSCTFLKVPDAPMFFNRPKLSHRIQFIDFCILSGCDFSSTLRNIGPVTAMKLLKSHKSIEGILSHISTSPKLQQRHPPKEGFDHLVARTELSRRMEIGEDVRREMWRWEEGEGMDLDSVEEFVE